MKKRYLVLSVLFLLVIVFNIVVPKEVTASGATGENKYYTSVQVKEGDSLAECGINAKIIELPGHTKGSIGVDVEESHLLVGDALDNWIKPAMGHLYCDIDAIKKTQKKIKSLGKRTIYFGHGNPVTR